MRRTLCAAHVRKFIRPSRARQRLNWSVMSSAVFTQKPAPALTCGST